MAKYLLIESRDPFESRDVSNWVRLASDLKKAGNEVTLFLVQNGVLGARATARAHDLATALESKVEVLADEFSLRARGIDSAALVSGVKPAALDVVVDRLAEGCRTLWH